MASDRKGTVGQNDLEHMMNVVSQIGTERVRQMRSEGWTLRHDDEHTDGSLAMASACYASHRGLYVLDQDGQYTWAWPDSWSIQHWKPKGRLRSLVVAGALIVAEIERLERLNWSCSDESYGLLASLYNAGLDAGLELDLDPRAEHVVFLTTYEFIYTLDDRLWSITQKGIQAFHSIAEMRNRPLA